MSAWSLPHRVLAHAALSLALAGCATWQVPAGIDDSALRARATTATANGQDVRVSAVVVGAETSRQMFGPDIEKANVHAHLDRSREPVAAAAVAAAVGNRPGLLLAAGSGVVHAQDARRRNEREHRRARPGTCVRESDPARRDTRGSHLHQPTGRDDAAQHRSVRQEDAGSLLAVPASGRPRRAAAAHVPASAGADHRLPRPRCAPLGARAVAVLCDRCKRVGAGRPAECRPHRHHGRHRRGKHPAQLSARCPRVRPGTARVRTGAGHRRAQTGADRRAGDLDTPVGNADAVRRQARLRRAGRAAGRRPLRVRRHGRASCCTTMSTRPGTSWCRT